jgi:hypothetical protein
MLLIGNIEARMILLLIGNTIVHCKNKNADAEKLPDKCPSNRYCYSDSTCREPPQPDREPVKILLIGSPKAVRSIIHILYRLGFASVSEWIPLQPAQKPGEVMSILMRYLRLE